MWLEQAGLSWLHALEDENAAVESAPTLATQARLGYCWARLSLLFPQRAEFGRAANKSFHAVQDALPVNGVYDQSFFLLFMAWYYRAAGEPDAVRLLKDRYSFVGRHLDNAGVGGFGPQTVGLRSHNPYMHLLEALLAAFHATRDDYWLAEAQKIVRLFEARLLDRDKRIVFEFLNPDWSVAGEGRVEIGHQFEWSTLLLELYEITGSAHLLPLAESLYRFALRRGFESGLVIDAIDDRRKLLWGQTEAARHCCVRARILRDENARSRAAEQWRLTRQHFIHPNGWTWYNCITAEGAPVAEPSLARLLYHVVAAAAETSASVLFIQHAGNQFAEG